MCGVKLPLCKYTIEMPVLKAQKRSFVHLGITVNNRFKTYNYNLKNNNRLLVIKIKATANLF